MTTNRLCNPGEQPSSSSQPSLGLPRDDDHDDHDGRNPTMHTAPDLLAELTAAGIRIDAHGDRLHVDAPPGTMTPELRQRLLAHKADLLAVIEVRDRLLAMAAAEGLPRELVDVRTCVLDEYIGEDDDILRACLYAWARERPATCVVCGPVLLPDHWPRTVTACPWCGRTRQGLPIPRPAEDGT